MKNKSLFPQSRNLCILGILLSIINITVSSIYFRIFISALIILVLVFCFIFIKKTDSFIQEFGDEED